MVIRRSQPMTTMDRCNAHTETGQVVRCQTMKTFIGPTSTGTTCRWPVVGSWASAASASYIQQRSVTLTLCSCAHDICRKKWWTYLDELPWLIAYETGRNWLTSENDLVHSPDSGCRTYLSFGPSWTMRFVMRWQEFLASVFDYWHLAGYLKSF